MLKKYICSILFSFALFNCFAQVPVMNPITGASVVCSSPAPQMNYTASANNTPLSYSWSVVSPTPGVVISNPTSSTTSISFPYSNAAYTVYCSATNGFGTSPTTSFVVNVFQTPSVTFSGANSFCSGSNTILQASSTILPGSATISYNWAPVTGINPPNSGTVTASPSVTTTYTVTGTIGTCSNSSQITVSVLPTPIISVNITNTVMCAGNLLTLTASGANTYTWTGGVINGIPFTPIVSANYTVTATGTNVCTAKAVSTVVVNQPPLVTANATSPVICYGGSTTLFGTGAVNYLWTGGVVNNVPFSPTVTATYTLTGTSPGCPGTSSAVKTITVNPTPSISASPNPALICEGETATITISGSGTSYSLNGVSTTSSAIISPTITTTYTVDAVNEFGCTSTDTLLLTVDPCVGMKSIHAAPKTSLVTYPNPNNGSFVIRSGTDETITIVDELGREIRTIKLQANIETNINGLAGGCYFINSATRKIKIIVIE